MTTENGATVGDVESVNNQVETNESQSGGETANTNTDTVNTEVELLKKELAGAYSKNQALREAEKRLKELEEKQKREEFERKSEKEQLEHLKSQMDAMDRRAKLAQELEGTGVSVDVAEKIMAGDVSQSAQALKEILANVRSEASERSVEDFKATFRNGASKEAPAKTIETEDAFTKAFGQGAGI